MDEELQEILDEYRIRKVLSTYCHGVDRLDQVRASSVYAEDSWDEHGPYSKSGPDFIEGAMARMAAGSTVNDSHMLGQTLTTITGDTAGAETYFIFVGRRVHDDGSETLLQLGGRYVDNLVREEGGWKVKKRVCVRDWSISHPVAEDWLKGVAWVQGKRTNDDPSFAALGVEHSGVPRQA